MLLNYLILLLAIIWLLAVYKVYILDDGSIRANHSNNESQKEFQPILQKSSPEAIIPSSSLTKSMKIVVKETFPQSSNNQNDINLSEFMSYAESRYRNRNNPSLHQFVKTDNPQLINHLNDNQESNPHDQLYKWPPLLPDGSIPVEDGFDIMPITELKVPRFWIPPKNIELEEIGSIIKEQPSIFLMIASYRDFQCRETITSAFMRADHPERLFVGAVDQLAIVDKNIGCLDLEIPCNVDETQPICKYRNQISVYTMDASTATGPVTARHIGDRMYRGQYYVMQIDAHCLFVRHWDTKIISQFKSTGNEMAVLSSYLSDVQGSITADGDSTRQTRPIMCNSDFEGTMPARYLRHLSQPEDYPEIRGMPQLQPFWAAGFSFSRGHFKIRVPYDAYQPMVFQGEEIAVGIRGFTHGYDFYAPEESVVFHEYAVNSKRRVKIPFFTENRAHAGEGKKSIRRATAVIGMAPDLDPTSWDHSELDKYGIGSARNLSLFYKLFLIDPNERKAVQLCPFVKTGIMHTDFQKFLRKNGRGIDYSRLANYDTAAKIDSQLKRQHPYWEKRLRDALKRKDRADLQESIDNAVRVRLNLKLPDLIKQAEDALKTI